MKIYIAKKIIKCLEHQDNLVKNYSNKINPGYDNKYPQICHQYHQWGIYANTGKGNGQNNTESAE